jgi:hypothetical protein
MSKKHYAGLASLLALAAFAAMPALAQAASPELGRCTKKAVTGGSGYANATCTTTTSGSTARYEWLPGPGPKRRFTSTEGASTFETVAKGKVTCKSDVDEGEYTDAKTDTETIVFSGCESSAVPCTSAGQAAGTIVTTALTSSLGVIDKAKKEVGVSLEGPSSVFAEFKCGASSQLITGSVIGKVPVNKVQTGFTESFTQAKGKQKPEQFEGQSKDTLNCGELQCAFKSKDKVVNEEALEIRLSTSPRWWVEGKLLVGSEAIAEATNVTTPFELAMTGKDIVEPFTIQCTGVRIKGGDIQAPGTRTEQAVVYEGCSVPGKPTCIVGTTETKPLTATLEGPAGATKLKFEPQSGNEIATYVVTGCAVFGSYRANGDMICDYSGVEVESAEHPLEFTTASKSKVKFQFNGKPMETAAPFTGTDRVHLASGKLWSAY